jgi:hypothetical protein
LALEIGKLAASCHSHSALGKNLQYPMDRRQGWMLVWMLKRRVQPLVPARNPWFPMNTGSRSYVNCFITNFIYTAHPPYQQLKLFFALATKH